MNKKSIIITYILLIIIILNINQIISSIPNLINNFYHYTFPPLFISLIVSSLLIKINVPYYLSKFIKNYSIRLFLLSIITGFPNNILFIKNDLKNNIIKESDIGYLICFTTLNSPLYLIYILKKILNKHALIYLIIYYLINFIICLLFINKVKYNAKVLGKNKLDIKSFITNDIPNIMINLIKVSSIIIFFGMFSSLINTNNFIASILKGIIEFTSGLNSLVLLDLPTIKKGIISLMILLFSSFSIHIQLSYYLNDLKVNYKYYYLIKCILLITFRCCSG